MTWLQRYRVRHYFSNSIWIFPVLSAVAAVVAVRLLHRIESELGVVAAAEPATATTVLSTLASALFTSIVFVCTALLVAVQLASAALTPRIIAMVFRDPITKSSLTLLVFSFTFTLGALLRIKQTVPLLTANAAAYGSLINLAVFFYLIDHLGKSLRPSGALRAVGRFGGKVIDGVYPRRFAEPRQEATPWAAAVPGAGPATTISNSTDGVVLAFDQGGLLSLAQRADCVLELVPQVGDYVAAGDPLFRVYQGGAGLSAGELGQMVAVGQERTPEQDPAFAFRVLVDIACKALSPAINDPTTAVLALDQIHSLLRKVGNRHLDDGRVRDAAGRLRLLYRTPDWDDFVRLAVTEIRHYGGTSIQIARRLRAVLENLIQTLPPSRTELLRRELTLLHRTSDRLFADPEDRALAEISDFQGVGGKHEQSRPSVS